MEADPCLPRSTSNGRPSEESLSQFNTSVASINECFVFSSGSESDWGLVRRSCPIALQIARMRSHAQKPSVKIRSTVIHELQVRACWTGYMFCGLLQSTMISQDTIGAVAIDLGQIDLRLRDLASMIASRIMI